MCVRVRVCVCLCVCACVRVYVCVGVQGETGVVKLENNIREVLENR